MIEALEAAQSALIDGYRQAVETNMAMRGHLLVAPDPEQAASRLAVSALMNAKRLLASGATYAVESEPDYPVLEKMLSASGKGVGILNADCVYRLAALNGSRSYLLSGNRGTAKVLDVAVYRGGMEQLQQPFVCSLASAGIELAMARNFSLKLGGEPVDGMPFMPLPDGNCFVITREYFYDWDQETRAFLFLERDGANYPPPPLSISAVAERHSVMGTYTRNIAQIAQMYAGRMLKQQPNEVIPFTYETGDFRDLDYAAGHFVLGEDEALIIELVPPETPYWSICVTDLSGNSLHQHMRQTSLNGHQARLDADGKCRAVLSHVDPGVNNWLDTGGEQIGIINMRFMRPDRTPELACKVVPVADVRGRLPRETIMIERSERNAALRARLLAAHRLNMLEG